jgi:hypothetical protein
VVRGYTDHYNHQRPHRGIGLATPAGMIPPTDRAAAPGRVARRDVLGGLVHQYFEAAA